MSAATLIEEVYKSPSDQEEFKETSLQLEQFFAACGFEHPAIALIDVWLEDDSGYDEEVWPTVERNVEENALSARPRFHG